MDIVFSHVWAIWWWRYTHTQATADSLRTNRCSLGKTPSSVEEIEQMSGFEIRQEQVDRGFPRELPMTLLFEGRAFRSHRTNIQIRRWNGRVPAGSLCKAGNFLTASPEFCFLLVASDIRRICQEGLRDWQYIIVLVELGCELCGTYSKQISKRGFINRKNQLVGTWQMRDFVCHMAHERGAKLAYKSLFWVIDGLNSPMETAVYLMMCLPRTWGGLALPRPWSNSNLSVPEELWNKTWKRHVMPDLYWPEQGLVVEFFGEDFHAGNEREDLERQEIEQDMGLKIVTFWKEDVLDLKRFNAKAASVARYLGRELPEMSANFSALQATLQMMLVKHQRWI